MLFEQLNHDEQIDNLHRLHGYLNHKYFGDNLSDNIVFDIVKLTDAEVMFWIDTDGQEMIFLDLGSVIRYKMITKRIDESSSERLQLQWVVTVMIRAMVQQQIHEQDLPETDFPRLAEKAGLMSIGERTEWINPLRFAFIEKEFHLEKGEAALPVKESARG